MTSLSPIQTPLDIRVREHLAQYLRADIDFPTFKPWFLANTWDVEREGTRSDMELVHNIHIRLIEFSNGDWTEDELKSMLVPVLQTYRSYEGISYTESSASIFIVAAAESRNSRAGVRFALAPA
jgi:hypothetical protein